MGSRAPTVVIADDHPGLRAGIRTALELDGFVVTAEVGHADAAVEAAVRDKPDLCLLDVRMPGGGIQAAKRINELVSDVAVVMLTVSEDDADLFAAFRAGARGYLLKDMNIMRLPDALRGVLRGEAGLPRRLTARLIDEFAADERRRGVAEALTRKQWEVLELLREGFTTVQIAERLYVSPVTVRTHIAAALRKLNVASREEVLSLLDET